MKKNITKINVICFLDMGCDVRTDCAHLTVRESPHSQVSFGVITEHHCAVVFEYERWETMVSKAPRAGHLKEQP